MQKTKVLTLLRDVALAKCITTMKGASEEEEDNFVTKLHFFADQVLNVKMGEDRENSISMSSTVLVSADRRLHYDFDIQNKIVLKRIWQEYRTSLPDL